MWDSHGLPANLLEPLRRECVLQRRPLPREQNTLAGGEVIHRTQNKETGDTQSDVSSLHQDVLEERGPAGLILQGLLAPMPQPVRLGVLLF